MHVAGASAGRPGGVQRVWLQPGETLEVYRLVHVERPGDLALLDDFRSRAAHRLPARRGRERDEPLIYGGVSVYKTPEQAVARRQRILDRIGSDEPLLIGDYLARLVLHDPCFAFEDRNEPTGHVTIWGDPFMLVAAVADVYPA